MGTSDGAEASPLLTSALRIAEGSLELAAAVQSERQQLAMAHALRSYLDAYLSISRPAKLSTQDVYRHVLGAKGAVLERTARLRIRRGLLQARPDSEAQAVRGVHANHQAAFGHGSGGASGRESRAMAIAAGGIVRRKDELEAELSRLDAGFRAGQTISTRTPAELQAALPDATTALVDYLVYRANQAPVAGKGKFRFERRVLAFVLRTGRPVEQMELGPLATIQEAVDDWRPRLRDQNAVTTAGSDAGRALRRLVWEPLEAHLEGVRSVLVSPDGPIALVPLGALPGREPGRYLIEDCSIAIVPVPRMLASAATGSAPGQRTGAGPSEPVPSLLLAGDIDYGAESGKGGALAMTRSAATHAGRLTPCSSNRFLPHVERFWRYVIRSRSDFANARVRGAAAEPGGGGSDSSEGSAVALPAPRNSWLLRATGAALRGLGPADPKTKRPGFDPLGGAGIAGWHPGLLSGIALARHNVRPTPVGQDDGILTSLEVAELDLSHVELAVLSACETGLGEVAGGEGLLGLQRAFQVSRANSVIASLWNNRRRADAGADGAVLRKPVAQSVSRRPGRMRGRRES